jgi:hypothetical protein
MMNAIGSAHNFLMEARSITTLPLDVVNNLLLPLRDS